MEFVNEINVASLKEEFTKALESYYEAQSAALKARIEYEAAYATAMATSEGKNEQQRKADAASGSLAQFQKSQSLDLGAECIRRRLDFLTNAVRGA